jgi:pyridinium-3,5-bisthiocarboxylic acid mononucleotide nickel chelatase
VTGEPVEAGDRAVVVETSIDDMNPEFFGFLMERLFEGGALDVYLIPIYMKKNRPGTLLQVLCRPADRPSLSRLILSETTTLGVRYYAVERDILEREAVTLDTVYGPVSAKKVRIPFGGFRIVPEYEACREIARRENIPIRVVYDRIVQNPSA